MIPAITARQSSQQGAAQTSQFSIAAPSGGLNTRENLAALPPSDAQTLINMVPGPAGVISRRGYTEFASGLDGVTETIVEYSDQAVTQMVAASGTKIYTVSTNGTETEIGTGFTNARWQTAQSNNVLIMVNGEDAPQQWDGTTLGAITMSGTGLTAANLLGVMIHQSRAFYIENNAPWFWYAGAGAYSGTLTKFDLSQIASKGGNIKCFGSWSRDGGSGPDDYAVFIMTTGEVIVYQGIDPGDAAAWSLVGRYYISAPVDVRGVAQFANDLFVMTQDDYVPLSKVLAQAGSGIVSTKLTGAASDVWARNSNNTGWQAHLYTRSKWMLFNVPKSSTEACQFGIYTPTGACFQFEGWNARCFGNAYDRLYMGGTGGKIYLCDEGLNDNGVAINIECQQAFAGDNRRKQVTAFIPVIVAQGDVTLDASVAFDYGTATVFQRVSSGIGGVQWDAADALWDVALWAPEGEQRGVPYCAVGTGRAVSLRIKTKLLNQQVGLYRTDYLYKRLRGFV